MSDVMNDGAPLYIPRLVEELRGAFAHLLGSQKGAQLLLQELARGGSVIQCPYPLNALKDAYDHS